MHHQQFWEPVVLNMLVPQGHWLLPQQDIHHVLYVQEMVVQDDAGHALHCPLNCFNYMGFNPPPWTGFDLVELTKGKSNKSRLPFQPELYSCHSKVLDEKRHIEHNPFAMRVFVSWAVCWFWRITFVVGLEMKKQTSVQDKNKNMSLV